MELGNLTNCTTFDLSNNDLTGEVPGTLISVPGTTSFLLRGQSGCLSTLDMSFAMWLDSKDIA